jgi:hypothetical protein
MFLRSHGRSKDGKDHTYWSLVETVHTPNGPRQKTLCYLGELNSSAQARWLKTAEARPRRRSERAGKSLLHQLELSLPDRLQFHSKCSADSEIA